ncbi:hypothetical protein FDJ57_gp66 [Gordonia phage Sour]|uniref:Uncharacterized protein n=1 Tax=Gordonia phage Sour TaxID=2182349 RepID=A0A2U8UKR2_9CAUD|nr:hypothetical protein FDJ57_gp66 [Gordonia phage Sour]AWN04267.1 hypothetical protein PBI_SOUR_66 [Gordonia phage Sour]
MIPRDAVLMPLLCRLGLHVYPRFVTARIQASGPIRCERCRRPRRVVIC